MSAIDALAANRKTEIEKTISKLTDISDKARKGLEVARSERAASMDDQALAQAKEAVSYVDDTLASFGKYIIQSCLLYVSLFSK